MNNAIYSEIIKSILSNNFTAETNIHIHLKSGVCISSSIEDITDYEAHIVISSMEEGFYCIPYDSIDYIML